MNISSRIALLTELGHYLRSGGDADLEQAISWAYLENKWFTEDNVRRALQSLADQFLQTDLLEKWVTNAGMQDVVFPAKTIGLVMAGNIPLVGFHDWLCVFCAGFRAKVKLSDKDKRLLPLLTKKMGEWEKESFAYTEYVGETEALRGFDAVIATGSNNSARYFEQYFGKYPHIIRRNRHAVAILTGEESMADLYALGQDIFAYFGLGCRNVSKIYVPAGYSFEPLLEALHEYRAIIHHDKYKNNFDYNLTLYILNNMPYLNNGCVLLREDDSFSSRIASVHYSYYEDVEQLQETLGRHREAIQCLVGHHSMPGLSAIPFGQSQQPGLTDYADGVDVMAFLKDLAE